MRALYDDLCAADGVQLVGFAHAVKEYSFGYLPGAYRRLLIKPDKATGGLYNEHSMHSTDVESIPTPLRTCMSIHPEGKSCSSSAHMHEHSP